MEKQFDGLAQRLAYAIMATFPPFSPISGDVSVQAQEQTHLFLQSVAGSIFREPGLLGLPALPDGAFEDWQQFKSDTALADGMRRVNKRIEEFYRLLISLGCAGVVRDGRLTVSKNALKVTPRVLALLGVFGLAHEARKFEVVIWSDGLPGLAEGWAALARQTQNDPNWLALFSRSIFNVAQPRSVETYRTIAGDADAFDKLVSFFNDNSYNLVENSEGISVDWVKSYAKTDGPLKSNWAERSRGGLSVVYDNRRRNPVIYGLRLPMFREVLQRFDGMGERVKALVMARTKKCDGCGYCTQTDKTGKRPRQIVAVEYKGQGYELCALYPGFSYVWTKLDGGIVDDMIGLLAFMDEALSRHA